MNAPITNVAPPAVFRQPTRSDGDALHSLIASCPPLDLNSTYAYLLLCEHHADTCVIAESAGKIAGVITGYRHPQRPDTLFVWQVAVSPEFRRQSLAARMLEQLFANGSSNGGYRYIETTVSPDNAPSHNLFQQFAKRHGVALEISPLFAASDFGSGHHQAEPLYRLGPWSQTSKF